MGSWAIWTKTFQNGWEPHRNAATTDEYEYRTDLCINATVAQRPRLTCVLTHGTHGDIDGFTNLFTDETMNQDMTATIKEHTCFKLHQYQYKGSWMDRRLHELTWLGWSPSWRDHRGRQKRQPGPQGSTCQCTSPTMQSKDRFSHQSTSWERQSGQNSPINCVDC